MNILFFGDGQWAHLAFMSLMKISDINVVGVVLRYNNPDKHLERMALDYKIPVHVVPNINDHNFIELCKALQLDLGVSMSYNQIIKRELRNTCRNGVINCHAGKLPFYRGRNVLNWVLINDEREFGVTVHYIDDGIDTGDIISQAVIPIEETDNYNSLLNKAILKCPEILIDAIMKIKENRIEKIPQSHIKGTYFSYRRIGDEFIDWNWTSRRIHNFIRALVEPAPGAQAYLEGEKVFLWRSEEVDYPPYISTPGEIILKEVDGIIVKTVDSAIKIKEISYSIEGPKFVPKFAVGKRFTSDLYERIIAMENKICLLEERLRKYENGDQ